MSRQPALRNLTLTEELEKLEQSITLTLQEIDSHFSRATRIVTGSILPIVDQYGKHCEGVWEGSKVRWKQGRVTVSATLTGSQFWKQFFEASANVSLSGYEEPNQEDEDITHTDGTSTSLETPTDHDEYLQGGAEEQQGDDEEFTVDSPTQVTGVQTTPKIGSAQKKTNGKAAYRSPSPRKYTGKNPMGRGRDDSEEPSTPRPQAGIDMSSPFEPESAAYQPSTQKRTNNDPLMHRVLDKNYRVQATPHTQRRKRQQGEEGTLGKVKGTPATATKTRRPWDDSPQSSPEMAAPELRSDLFSPVRPAVGGPRTPGISVLTPARNKTGPAVPTTSTGRQLFSPQDKTYSNAKDRTNHIFSDDDEDTGDGFAEISPPKTMQFHVPQSRLMQTPAREASKRIVEDLLLTAGADNTDDIEGYGEDEIDMSEPSPSVVKRVWEEDTF